MSRIDVVSACRNIERGSVPFAKITQPVKATCNPDSTSLPRSEPTKLKLTQSASDPESIVRYPDLARNLSSKHDLFSTIR
jgi:hypothetical protein